MMRTTGGETVEHTVSKVVEVNTILRCRNTIVLPAVTVNKGLGYRDVIFSAVDNDWGLKVHGR